MTRAEIIEQLKNEYRQYRAQAEREQDERAAEIERVDPQIRVLWEKQATTPIPRNVTFRLNSA